MDVVVPDLGDFSDVEVIEVLVAPGAVVAPEDPLITLETDKAAMDVPSPASGSIRKLKVAVGDKVSAGDLILVLDTEAAAADSAAEDPAAIDEPEAADPRPVEDLTVRQPRPGELVTAPLAVTVPDLGDFADVDVIEVLVTVGEEVEAEHGLITLETDKATMDVPAPVAGTVVELKLAAGDQVNAGDEVLILRPRSGPPDRQLAPETTESAADVSVEPAPEASAVERRAAPPARPATAAAPAVAIDEAGFSRAHASPSVRKLARELGVDLVRVSGTGAKHRVTATDVKAYVKEIMTGRMPGAAPALPPIPEVDFAKYGPVELEPLGRIQRISGPRLHASWVNIPHVTQHDEADITKLEETRQSLKEQAIERGIRLTPLAFVIRACVLTLAEFPRLKSSLSSDGETLVMKRYTHIGFAADTPNGLVVPVIRDADQKDVYELAQALAELSERAREGKLKTDDIEGGVFTISSLGGIGGTFFTPIINAPEVAILGVSRSAWKPVLEDAEFVPRLYLPLSLSYDHRVIDGATAVRFTTRLAATLGEVERLLEAIP